MLGKLKKQVYALVGYHYHVLAPSTPPPAPLWLSSTSIWSCILLTWHFSHLAKGKRK
jgi:hypothetical protein